MLLFFKDKYVFTVIAFILAASLSIAAYAAPDVELEDLNGNRQNLNAYIGHGKWTVLNIWGPGCPPCEEEMPELVLFHERNKSTRAIVVGVAIDFPSYGYANKDKVKAFVEDFLVDFPILLSDSSISEQIGAGVLEGLPTTYVYTPEGKLVGMQVGGITGMILDDYIDRYDARHKQESVEK